MSLPCPIQPLSLAVLLGLLATACLEEQTVCRSSNDCRATELCVEQRCRAVCNRSNDCRSGEGCHDGVCLPRRDTGVADANPDRAAGSDAATDTRALDTRQPDTRALDTRQPDTAEPDAAEPDAAEPDTAEPDCGTCNQGETCTPDGCRCPATGAACDDGEVCLSSGCCAAGCAANGSCCTAESRCCPSGHCDDDCDGDGQQAMEVGGDDCDDDCDTCYYGSAHGTRTPDGLDQDCDGTTDDTEAQWLCDPAAGSSYLVDHPDCDDACAAIACEAFCQVNYGLSGSAIDFSSGGSLACWTSAFTACGGAYWCTEICIRGSGPANCTSNDPNVDGCICETAGSYFF